MRIFVFGADGEEPKDVADLAEAQALADKGQRVLVPSGRKNGDDDIYIDLEPTTPPPAA